MRIARKWHAAALVGLTVVSAWAGQAKADFAFDQPRNLGPQVNSDEREYDPALSSDGLELYFQSYRAGGYGASDLYVARRATTEDPWDNAQNLGPVINTAAAESGPSLSADGLTLYFNSDRSGGMGGHDLYLTKRASRSDPWGAPVNLGPVVNSEFSEINPNISSDGLSLFFADVEGDGAALRPGGYGGADIWVSTRVSLSEPWGPPVNLGAPVNDGWSNGAPEISSDGLLLFFNYYRGDQAFFDIYVSMRKTTQDPWSVPVSLGAPVNGASWDGNAELASDGRTLYFASTQGDPQGLTNLWQVSIEPIVDFDGDGDVDDAEVRILMANWGTDEPVCDIGPAPFGDGAVDMKDLAVLTRYASMEIADPTLLACWGFDEGEDAVAHDGAGTCEGHLVGAPLWRPDGGAVGGAIQLDGAGAHVEAACPYGATAGPMSIFAWVKGGGPGQVVLSQQDAADWLLAAPSTGALMTDLQSGGRSTRALASQAVITDGNWHRIGLTWDGGTRRLYVDDRLVAEDTQTTLKRTHKALRIGGAKDLLPDTFWSGLIDDVRIYDRLVKP